MELALLLARLVLAGVFIVAGVAKLADRKGSTEAMEDFGAPARFAPLAGTLLPLAEIAVAIALIPTATARWGALGALALLLLFVAGIGYNLARGNAPDCHCFGQLHSEPAGWPTLVRNGALATVAAFVLWQGWNDPGASTVAWLGDLSAFEGMMTVAGILMFTLIVAEGWLLVQVMQQNGRLLVRLDALETGNPIPPSTVPDRESPLGLPVGAPAPSFALPSLTGDMTTLDALRAAGKPTMLIFISPNCKKCTDLFPDIRGWQRDHNDIMTIAVISRGSQSTNRSKIDGHEIQHVLLQEELEVAKAYQLAGTPSAVLVRPDGTIGSPLAGRAEGVRRLVTETIEAHAHPRSLPVLNGKANGSAANGTGLIGKPAPDARLSTLDGDDVQLSSFTGGEPTALLFWNPGCGFCKRMLDDLKQVEAEPPEGAPRLVIVSTGDPERNRSMGLTSTVLLDQGFSTGRAFGANGTPSAVLLDAEGKVASSVVVGTPAVLALAGAPQDSPSVPT